MNTMKSFGLGYKLKDPNSEVPEFDVHINVWNIPPKTDCDITPFVDFGIKISKYKNVRDIIFTIPFAIQNNELIDLSYLLRGSETQLIFNDISYKYEENPKEYNSISKGSEIIAFLPLKNSSGDTEPVSQVEIKNRDNNSCNILIHLENYSLIPINATAVYFRLRIESHSVAESLLSTVKEKNYYLESAFIEKQIIDIKFNNARNIDKVEIARYADEKFEFAKMNSIHLFLMVPSSHEVTIWDNFSECRNLESEGWEDYLQDKVSTDKIAVYHWKKKKEQNSPVDEFTQLIKIEHKATDWKIILMYCFIVIILGAIGSLVASFFSP